MHVYGNLAPYIRHFCYVIYEEPPWKRKDLQKLRLLDIYVPFNTLPLKNLRLTWLSNLSGMVSYP